MLKGLVFFLFKSLFGFRKLGKKKRVGFLLVPSDLFSLSLSLSRCLTDKDQSDLDRTRASSWVEKSL